MKPRMNKLAVFVIATTMTMFIAVAMTSASGNHLKAIRGEYAATGTLSCNGYYEDGSLEGSGTVSQLTVYTFDGEGKGSMHGYFVRIGFIPPAEMTFDFSWDFTYSVGKNGTITTTTVPGTQKWTLPGTDYVILRDMGVDTFSESGWISSDHKTIVLGTLEPQVQNLILSPPGAPETVFITKTNASRVLIRIGQ